MDINTLGVIVALLIGLSVASERLVGIIKGLIPFLNQENPDPTREGWRTSALQVLAVVAGITTALLARPLIPTIVPGWDNIPALLALGLLASGGSGFWNSIQGYVNQVKDIKKLEVREKRIEERSLQAARDREPRGPDAGGRG
jgi:hypothetical protein